MSIPLTAREALGILCQEQKPGKRGPVQYVADVFRRRYADFDAIIAHMTDTVPYFNAEFSYLNQGFTRENYHRSSVEVSPADSVKEALMAYEKAGNCTSPVVFFNAFRPHKHHYAEVIIPKEIAGIASLMKLPCFKGVIERRDGGRDDLDVLLIDKKPKENLLYRIVMEENFVRPLLYVMGRYIHGRPSDNGYPEKPNRLFVKTSSSARLLRSTYYNGPYQAGYSITAEKRGEPVVFRGLQLH